MLKRGAFWALVALIIGIFSGLYIKKWAEDSVFELIDDEARSACAGCHLEKDTFSISLFTVSGIARSVKLVKEGKTYLHFDTIKVRSSISKIFQKIIPLELDLINGHANGVGDDTPTYQFIDYLSQPAKPNTVKKDRWKVELNRINLFNSSFEEPIDDFKLTGEKVEMTLQREGEDFILFPKIEELLLDLDGYSNPEQKDRRIFKLGTASCKLAIKDDGFHFTDVKLKLKNALVSAIADATHGEGVPVVGSSSFVIDASSIDLGERIYGTLKGNGALSGRLVSPDFHGTFEKSDTTPFTILNNGLPVVDLTSLIGKLSLINTKEGRKNIVEELKASGVGTEITAKTPITLYQGRLEGTLNVLVDQIKAGVFNFEKIDADIILDSPVSKFEPAINLSTGRTSFGKVLIPAVSANSIVKDNIINLEVFSGQKEYPLMKLKGELLLNDSSGEFSESSNFEFSDFPILTINNPDTPNYLRLNGKGKIAGPLDSNLIKITSNLDVHIPTFKEPIKTDFIWQDGQGKATGSNLSQTVSLKATVEAADDKTSQLKIEMKDFAPENAPNCTSIFLKSEYNFPNTEILNGYGNVNVSKVTLGCAPYNFDLITPKTISVKDGIFNFNDSSFKGINTVLNLGGKFSTEDKLDLSIKGDINLGTFANGVNRVEELRGKLGITATITGSLGDPKINGSGFINGGELRLNDGLLVAEEVNGDLELSGNKIQLNKIIGKLNGGSLLIDGILPLTADESYKTSILFDDVLIQPNDNAYAVVDGRLTVEDLTVQPKIKGDINVIKAQFEKNFNLNEIVKIIRDFFEDTRKQQLNINQGSDLSPSLDIQINANRNFQVITNWLESELKGSLHVVGNLDKPLIAGNIESLNGWLGLKDRKFNITSSLITFIPGVVTPEIELLAESSVPSANGESTVIVLEATGPIDKPKINLSSDRGLSEKEILALLVSSGQITNSNDIRSLGFGFSYSDLSLGKRDTPNQLNSFLYNITKIDKLSVEPSYNTLSGAIEPAIAAEKKLDDNFYLKGQGLFGAVSTQSKGSINYQLSDILTLSGIVESLGAEIPISLGVDLSYIALSSISQNTRCFIEGNKYFSAEEIFKNIGLKENSLIKPAEIDEIIKELYRQYNDEGFFEAAIVPHCEESDGLCKKLTIIISEGKRSSVDFMTVATRPNDSMSYKSEEKILSSSEIASVKYLNSVIEDTTYGLRKAGYLGTRVTGKYEDITDKKSKRLVLDITTGQKIVFNYNGNSEFSGNEFFEEFNFLSRKQPFGLNTINSYIEFIEKKYRNKGYLLSSISYEKNIFPDNRVEYNINIAEESPVTVSKVQFTGNKSLSKRTLQKLLINEFGDDSYKVIFNPEFAIEEQISASINLIKFLYVKEGFQNVSINHSFEFSSDSKEVKIIYQIDEGDKITLNDIEIEGYPNDLPPLPKLPSTLSEPLVNEYIEKSISQLKSFGYFSSTITPSSEISGKQKFIIETGERTRIGQIILFGNNSVADDVIRRKLSIVTGEPWEEEKVNETKSNLLKLGMFLKADVKPADGKIDSAKEDVEIRLIEKPLSTLQAGAGVNSEYGAHFFGEVVDKSLFKDGKSLSFRSDLYYEPTVKEFSRGSANFLFTNPTIGDSDISWIEDLRFQKLTNLTQEFDVVRSSIGSFFFKRWNRGVSSSLGHSLISEDLSDVSPGAILSNLDDNHVTLSVFSGSTTYDGRDDALNPRRGFTISSDYKCSFKSALSDANFYSLAGRMSFITPLKIISDRLLIGGTSRVGSSWTFGDTNQIPITQRFYLGGRTTVRGFRENSLGPRSSNGDVIGGDILQANSLELQYLLTNNFSLHTFFDSGNVFLRKDSPDIAHLRVSTGLGMRYRSPIGPIGFDIAHPLDEKSGEPSVRFHFNIGTNF